MAERRLDILVSAKDNGATSFFDRLAAKAKSVRRDDRLSGETALGGFARGGVGGAADFGLSMLGLGGAAIGVQFAGTTLKQLATGLQEIRDLSKDVSKDWTDIADKMGRSVPVFGEVFAAGREIRELFTGTRAEIEAINAETKAMTAMQDSLTTRLKLQKETYAEMSKIITDLQRKLQIGGTSGIDAQLLQLGFNQEDTAETVRKKVEERIAKLQGQSRTELNQVNEKLPTALETLDRARKNRDAAFGSGMAVDPVTERRLNRELSDAQAEVDFLQGRKKEIAATRDEDVKRVNKAGQDALTLIQKTGEQDRTKILEEAERRRNEIRRNAMEQARDEEDAARQERLRAEGKTLEAELDLIATTARDKREAIARATQEAVQQTIDSGGNAFDLMALVAAAGRRAKAVDDRESVARSSAIMAEQSAIFSAMGQAMFEALSKSGAGSIGIGPRTAGLQSERFASGETDLMASKTYEIQKKTADNTKVTAEQTQRVAKAMEKFVNDSISGQVFTWGGLSNN